MKEERHGNRETLPRRGPRGRRLLASILVFAPAPAFAGEGEKQGPKAVSRSGLPYRPDDDSAGPPELVGAIRARRTGGKLLNLDRMLLHSPIVLNRADYEWAQHEGEFLKAGGTRAQLAALKDYDAARKDAKLFDEAERATLALTAEMTREIVATGVELE